MMAAILACSTSLALGAPATASELLGELERLRSTARVLYVAAHPDDENTRLISALTVERNVEVAYLSLTRGSGGQNRIGTEQGDLLGVLRSGELLAARAIDDGRQFFTRARDFGYSKRVEETLATWDEEAVLDDIVRVLREFRPDVVVTRFRETGNTHGHHLASAVLARRAVERLAEAGGWAPKRLVLDIPTWRSEAEDAEFEITVGAWAPHRGLTVGEIAARSRSRHRSQAFGVAPTRELRTEQMKTVWGPKAQRDLLEGVDASWRRLGDDGRIARALEQARIQLRPDQPAAMVPALLDARAAMDDLPEDPRVDDQRARLTALILAASGVFVRASTPAEGRAAGAPLAVEVEVANRAGIELRLDAVRVGAAVRPDVRQAVKAGAPWKATLETPVPPGPPTATPWLLRPDVGPAAVAPRGPDALVAEVHLRLEGRLLDLRVPVRRVWVDPSRGELEARFERLPALTATPVQEVRLMPHGAPNTVTFELRRHGTGSARVLFPVPRGWTARPAEAEIDGEGQTVSVTVEAPADGAEPFEMTPVLALEDRTEPLARLDVVDYPHIERTLALRPSVVRWVPLDLRAPEIRVGYVPGSGDRVAELLSEVGLEVRTLSPVEVAEADFDGLDVILTGVRAFNVHPTLADAKPRLFDWVESGGRLVIQYNTNSWYDALDEDLGPGELRVGRGRVTDETATVRRLDPGHPIWHRPHELGDEVWSGWVQERGLYFAETWDEGWKPLVALADPGEDELRGGLLSKQHGEGVVIYTGLSFFRQLPAGVPGAYRLLVNLLAHD